MKIISYKELANGHETEDLFPFVVKHKGKAESVAEALLARFKYFTNRYDPIPLKKDSSLKQVADAVYMKDPQGDSVKIEIHGSFGLIVNLDMSAIVFHLDGDHFIPHPLPLFLSSYAEAFTDLDEVDRRALLKPLSDEAPTRWTEVTQQEAIVPWAHFSPPKADDIEESVTDFIGRFLYWCSKRVLKDVEFVVLGADIAGGYSLRSGEFIHPEVRVHHDIKGGRAVVPQLGALGSRLLCGPDGPIQPTDWTSQLRTIKLITPLLANGSTTINLQRYLLQDYTAHERMEHLANMEQRIRDLDDCLMD